MLAGFNIRIKREKHFFCTKFVKYLFEEANVNVNLPKVPKTVDFQNIDGIKEIYRGYLRDYNIKDKIKI